MLNTLHDVRMSHVDALQIDVVGPIGALEDYAEPLPPSPSQWYLTTFLMPTAATEGQQGLEFEDG